MLEDCHTLDHGVASLNWNPSGDQLLTVDHYHVRSWDTRGQVVGQLDCLSSEYNDLSWKPDGSDLVVSSGGRHSNGLLVWNSGASLATVIGRESGYKGSTTVSWKPGGLRLASGGYGWNVKVFTDGGNLAMELEGHEAFIHQVSWGPDGKWLASAGEDGTIRLWGSDGIPGPVLKGHEGPVFGVAWRPDGQRLASAGADGTVRIWDQDGSPGLILKGHEGTVRAVAWRPDGRRLASAGADSTVRIWADDGVAGPVLRGHGGSVDALSWSPDGEWLASGGQDQTVRIWYADGIAGPVLRGHDQYVTAVAWSPPDGRRLASCGFNGVLCFWDSESATLDRIAVEMHGPKSITFDASGRVLEGDPAVIERELVYFIEEEGEGQLALKPSEFARRFPGALPSRGDGSEVSREE